MRLRSLFVFLLLPSLIVPVAAGQDAQREQRIVDNLKEQVSSLANLPVGVVRLEASRFEGLDEGTLQILTQNGPVMLQFLLSSDDKQFFLINGEPLDVSQDPAAKARLRAELIRSMIDGRPRRGNPDATQVIAEFSDFECPFCARGVEPAKEALAARGDAQLVFFHLPLVSIHPWAQAAALATECAYQQDEEAFWTLHDGLFERQGDITVDNLVDQSRSVLDGTGVDLDVWEACQSGADSMTHGIALQKIAADGALANQLEVQSTPTFFVNGVRFAGAVPAETLTGAMETQ